MKTLSAYVICSAHLTKTKSTEESIKVYACVPSAQSRIAGTITVSSVVAFSLTSRGHVLVSGPLGHVLVSGPLGYVLDSGPLGHVLVSGPLGYVLDLGPLGHVLVSGPLGHVLVSGPLKFASEK